jgi:hypothetical protein
VAEVPVLYRTFILSGSLGSSRSLHDPHDPYDPTTSRDIIAANSLDNESAQKRETTITILELLPVLMPRVLWIKKRDHLVILGFVTLGRISILSLVSINY